MSAPPTHEPRQAAPELLILQRWEELTAWLLEHTARWPKSHRHTFAQRVQNLALDITELLIEARYERGPRPTLLRRANLALERMRFLMRLAHRAHVMPARGFETAMRGIDETGRMLHGWRQAVSGGAQRRSAGSARAAEARS